MRSGEPLERDPSGDDGGRSETTSGDADKSIFMVRGRSTLPETEAVESIAMTQRERESVVGYKQGRLCERERESFGGQWVRRTMSTSTAIESKTIGLFGLTILALVNKLGGPSSAHRWPFFFFFFVSSVYIF